MPAAPLIRPLQAEDHMAWLPLWEGYQRFYKAEIPATTTVLTWQRLLDPSEAVNGALAWVDDRAIGMVHWIFHRSTWLASDSCYLQDLYVDPARRGSGQGRALIEHVYAQALVAGSTRVHWLTHADNTVARQLYDRLAEHAGFIQYRKNLR
ncbi:MAG: GNAT family N-acetyltransferase [Stagnimonas sp.]|nr:GNAT family N-acetyltransferase [Stagnimonas sp.]